MNDLSDTQVYADGDFIWYKKSTKVHMSGTYGQDSAAPVFVSFWSDTEESSRLFNDVMDVPNEVVFNGKDIFGKTIYISGIDYKQLLGFKKLDAVASFYMEGDNFELGPDNEKINIQLVLSHVPLLLSEWMFGTSFDGTIKKVAGGQRKGINWVTTFGKAQLIENYTYQISSENKSICRLKENVINLEYKPTSNIELSELLHQIPNLLYEDLLLLSFLCRKRINCQKAIFYQKGNASETVAKFNNWRGFYNNQTDWSSLRCLIKFHDLQNGLFEKLIKNFRASHNRELIKQSLPYIISSYEDGYMESHIVNAFFALEGMVNSLGGEKKINTILKASSFEKLAKSIRGLISNSEYEEDVKALINEKIAELNRRSFTNKLMFLLNEYKVNAELVWPANTNQEEGFHEIVNRRNNLIAQRTSSR